MENVKFEKIVVNSKPLKGGTVTNLKMFLNSKKGEGADAGRKLFANAARAVANNIEGSPEWLKGRIITNAAFEIIIPSKVEKSLAEVLGMFGEVHKIKINEAAKISMWERDRNGGTRTGAKGSDGTYQRKFKKSVAVEQREVTGFAALDYRDLMDDPDGEYASLAGEVTVDVVNTVVKHAEFSLVDGMKTAYTASVVGAVYLEAAGISQTSLDLAIAEVRTGGKGVNIFGDYRAVKQIAAFAGIDNRAADRSLVQFEDLGYIATYGGSSVLALDNFYDYSKSEALASGKVWAKQLSKANVYVSAKGEMRNPNHVFLYGGATTMTGKDISQGTEVLRVDQLFGTHFVAERAQGIAIVSDTNLQ